MSPAGPATPTPAGRDLGGLDLGGVPVAVESDHAPWMALFRDRYRPFATDAGPGPRNPALRLRYQVTDDRVPSPQDLFAARKEPLRVRRSGSLLSVGGAWFQAELDPAAGTAILRGPLATYPLDLLLQLLWYELVPDGLIFHSAALADEERGWLMCGPSGAGKSTLAGLFPDRTLCDELAGVRLGPEPRVAALPFWTGQVGSRPLASIYLLRHEDHHRRSEIDPREACRRLRQQVVWPDFDSPALERAFSTFFDLLERVPVWELGFRPDPEVWRVISQEEAA